MLVRIMEDWTGRKIEMDGLRLYVLLAVRLRATNIRVKNDPGRQRLTPWLTVSGLTARIRAIRPSERDWMKELEFATDLRGVSISTPAVTRLVVFQMGEFVVKSGSGKGTFAATLQDARVEGQVKVASLAAPSATFAITVSELDLAGLRALAVGGRPQEVGAAGAPQVRGQLLARGDVRVNRVIFAPLEAQRLIGRVSTSPTPSSWTHSASPRMGERAGGRLRSSTPVHRPPRS